MVPSVDSIYLGDNTHVLSKFDSDTIDLSVFSPPYDGIRDYVGDWKFDYLSFGKELFRCTRDGGVACVVIGDGTKDFAKSLTSFRLAVTWCDVIGWKLFETCIYSRDGNPGAWWNKRFRVDHEYILIFFKGKRPKKFDKNHLMVPSKHAGKTYTGTDRLTNGLTKKIEPKVVNDTKCRGTVWKYSTSNSESNKVKMEHPATYPDKLAEDLVLTFSDIGDVVLDPFLGSGTTAVVSRKHSRSFIGIDVSRKYCEVAVRRITAEGNPIESSDVFIDNKYDVPIIDVEVNDERVVE